ncbi:hypothetical protein B0H65DRAFT_538027 [Neurospora tetraspora]|uniref:Uncharacterized protein n=1 Tax=Neurospora tetraspora TaxID=94610 RepID=A0AAE0MV15_9PEZI|nr:hypothetical protein B0H65DRAFT_538027 [Neurospora tetraspora]
MAITKSISPNHHQLLEVRALGPPFTGFAHSLGRSITGTPFQKRDFSHSSETLPGGSEAGVCHSTLSTVITDVTLQPYDNDLPEQDTARTPILRVKEGPSANLPIVMTSALGLSIGGHPDGTDVDKRIGRDSSQHHPPDRLLLAASTAALPTPPSSTSNSLSATDPDCGRSGYNCGDPEPSGTAVSITGSGRSGYNKAREAEQSADTDGRSGYNKRTPGGRSGYNDIGEDDGTVSATGGRSGYNKAREQSADTDGRSGYNKVRDQQADTDGRSGYNKRTPGSGRSGYNNVEDGADGN